MLSDRCLSCLSCPVLSCLSVCDVGVLWPNGWTDQDQTWHAGRRRPQPHCVRREPRSPQRGTAPNFRCGQTAGWDKMPLGMKVGLSPGDFLLDGDPAVHPKKGGAQPPIFGTSIVRNGWMDQDATWYGGKPRPRRLVLDGDPAPPKGTQPPPNSRPKFVVAKRLDGLRCHLAWRQASAQATLC